VGPRRRLRGTAEDEDGTPRAYSGLRGPWSGLCRVRPPRGGQRSGAGPLRRHSARQRAARGATIDRRHMNEACDRATDRKARRTRRTRGARGEARESTRPRRSTQTEDGARRGALQSQQCPERPTSGVDGDHKDAPITCSANPRTQPRRGARHIERAPHYPARAVIYSEGVQRPTPVGQPRLGGATERAGSNHDAIAGPTPLPRPPPLAPPRITAQYPQPARPDPRSPAHSPTHSASPDRSSAQPQPRHRPRAAGDHETQRPPPRHAHSRTPHSRAAGASPAHRRRARQPTAPDGCGAGPPDKARTRGPSDDVPAGARGTWRSKLSGFSASLCALP